MRRGVIVRSRPRVGVGVWRCWGVDDAWDWLEVTRREYGLALGRAAVGRLAGSNGRGGVIGRG